MTNKSVKVIFDTNVWISFLIGKRLVKIKRHISEGSITIVITEQLLHKYCHLPNLKINLNKLTRTANSRIGNSMTYLHFIIFFCKRTVITTENSLLGFYTNSVL
ncbi:MAG: putative toxin-antitoxin system toxin component, PIN family [Bacteroidetes bacterium]|nr:putative toxin-antitoxin system toxin component, PIN family [Bacteroidota bacterium]